MMAERREEPVEPGQGGPSAERGTAIIFRKRLLHWSETFIANQGAALRSYHPLFVGYKRVEAGMKNLAGQDTLILSEDARFPQLSKGALKALGWVTPGWAAAMERREPTVVHAHFGVNAMNAHAIARRFDIPLVVTFHGMDITVKRGWWRRRERRRVFDVATRVIGVSQFIADRVLEVGCPPEKVVVHRIGVDMDRFSPGPEGAVEPGRILFVGRLVRKKGLDHLLRAMPAVQAAVPGAELVIVGDGPLREEMESLAREQDVRCRFIGVQTPGQVIEWLRSAAVMCAPSIVSRDGNAEGLPMTIMEAQATGVPVVAFPSGGSAEGVDEGRSGYVLPPGDEAALAGALVRLLGDESLRRSFAAAARSYAMETLNLDRQTRRLEAIYDEARAAAAAG